jgi:hypothetical protein
VTFQNGGEAVAAVEWRAGPGRWRPLRLLPGESVTEELG